MLETIIGSKSRAAIIKLFYLNEGKKFHIRGVARLLGISSNQARKEMIRLASAGLLKSEKAGNAILYFTNKDLPFHDELLGIVKKTAGFESIIKKKLARINGIRFAFIFGSYAEGKFNPKSDIDIMIIGKPDMVELNEAINKVEKEIRRRKNNYCRIGPFPIFGHSSFQGGNRSFKSFMQGPLNFLEIEIGQKIRRKSGTS